MLARWLKPIDDFVVASLPDAPARLRGRGRVLVYLALVAPILAFAVSLPDPQLRQDPLLLVLVGFAAVSFALGPLFMRLTRSLVWALLPLVLAVAVPLLTLALVGHPRALAGMVFLTLMPLIGVLIGGRTGLLAAVFPALIVLGVIFALPVAGITVWEDGIAVAPIVMGIFVLACVLASAAFLLIQTAEGDSARQAAADAEREVQRARLAAAQADRMAAVGLLATGVANGVNNPLTAALDAAQDLEEDLAMGGTPDPRRLRSLTSELSEALQQIRGTVAALEAFADPIGGDELGALDMEELVRAVVVAFRGSVPEGTHVAMQMDTMLPIKGRRSELAQALLALLRNAVQSRSPGRAPVEILITGGRTADDFVILEIRDDGEGMDAATLKRAFQPFFTTRSPGEGVGLGLSMARSIIKKAGGTLEIKSRLGHGTTARLKIPAAPVAYLPPSSSTATPAVLQRARILVIDDDELPLRVVGRALGERFQVTLEQDPRPALDRLAGREVFDLIICDVMMPTITGDRLYTEAVAIRPDLAGRFLFITGAVLGPEIRQRLVDSGCPVVRKPFGRDELVRSVSNILHEQSVRPATLTPT